MPRLMSKVTKMNPEPHVVMYESPILSAQGDIVYSAKVKGNAVSFYCIDCGELLLGCIETPKHLKSLITQYKEPSTEMMIPVKELNYLFDTFTRSLKGLPLETALKLMEAAYKNFKHEIIEELTVGLLVEIEHHLKSLDPTLSSQDIESLLKNNSLEDLTIHVNNLFQEASEITCACGQQYFSALDEKDHVVESIQAQKKAA